MQRCSFATTFASTPDNFNAGHTTAILTIYLIITCIVSVSNVLARHDG